jgi:hypothetical protein
MKGLIINHKGIESIARCLYNTDQKIRFNFKQAAHSSVLLIKQAALRFASLLPKPEERPRVISAFYLCAYSGFIIPPIGVGILSQFFSLNFALVILNSFAGIVVIYVLIYSVKFKQYYSKFTSQKTILRA